jgi:hypothetical protein
MINYLINNKFSIFFYIFSIIFSTIVALNILIISWPTISLPIVDYFSLFSRYLEFIDGKRSLLSFILSKHIDHNHAFVYALGLIDIILDDGRLRILHLFQILSNFITFGFLIYLAFKIIRPLILRSLLLIFISSQIFNLNTSETWIYPFQVVLTSFRLFLYVGIFYFCKELIKSRSKLVSYKSLIISIFLLFIVTLMHGSGIVIFFLLFFLACIYNKKIFFCIIPFLLLFILHNFLYPPHTSFTNLILRISIEEIFKSPYYLTFLSGNSFTWGGGGYFQ